MSIEICVTCEQESTPWKYINGHICQDCHLRSIKPSQWIPIDMEKPPKDGRYIVCEMNDYKWIGVAAMRNGTFDMGITHWMNLPEKPNASNTRKKPILEAKADEGN